MEYWIGVFFLFFIELFFKPQLQKKIEKQHLKMKIILKCQSFEIKCQWINNCNNDMLLFILLWLNKYIFLYYKTVIFTRLTTRAWRRNFSVSRRAPPTPPPRRRRLRRTTGGRTSTRIRRCGGRWRCTTTTRGSCPPTSTARSSSHSGTGSKFLSKIYF